MTTRRGTPTSSGKREGGSGKRRFSRYASPFPLPALAAIASLAACSPGAGTTAYIGATVWDGTGAPPILDAVIVVTGGRITDIGPPDLVSVPRGAREIRLDGRYVIPGLIDLHTHAQRWSLTRYLAYGVTAVRHLSGREDSVLALREDLRLGVAVGPRLYAAGALIDGDPPLVPHALVVRSGTQARRAIDTLTLLEMSWAKIHTGVTRALLEPLMDEARMLNLPVAAHLGRIDALTAARMGVRSIEHLTGIVQVGNPDAASIFAAYGANYARGFRAEELAWAGQDAASLDRTARLLAETGVAIVPTLVVHETVSRLNDARYMASVDAAGVPAAVREAYSPAATMRQLGLSSGDLVQFRTSRARQDLFVRRFVEHGGLLGAGTDSPSALVPPGASLHAELALLVAAGLTPERALLTATRDAARLLSSQSIGTLQPGNAADFVILDGDPLSDIGNLSSVRTTVSRGFRFGATALRQEWR